MQNKKQRDIDEKKAMQRQLLQQKILEENQRRMAIEVTYSLDS
jgi:hypothetical protein